MIRYVSAAQTSAETAPWWGTPLITGVFLLIGALIAFLASLVTKRTELRRIDNARWDDDILESALKITDGCQKIANNKFNEGESFEVWFDKMNGYAKELDAYLPIARRLDYIASPDVSATANSYLAAAFNLANKTKVDDVSEAQKRLERAREQFRVSIRKELRAKN